MPPPPLQRVYFRSQDPLNSYIDNPESPPSELSLPINLIDEGFPAVVPQGVGNKDDLYIRPVDTVVENVIQLRYSRPYDLILVHFLYYWLGSNLLQYDTKVNVNGALYT